MHATGEEIVLLQIRQDSSGPAPTQFSFGIELVRVEIVSDPTRRQPVLGVVMELQREADLFQIVGALRTSSRLARRLHRRQEQGNQHPDDGDDDQQFDLRKAADAHD